MPHRSCRRLVLPAALLVPLTVAAVLAAPAPQAGGGATTVQFRALLGDGSPAPDLKAADVTLKIDGRAREILSLKFVDLGQAESPAATPAAPAAPAAPAVAPPFTTNVSNVSGAAGRDVFILVDEESIAPGRDPAVKEAANHLLAALSSNDRAALMSVRQGGPNVGLTTDHSRVRTAITSVAGYGNTNETVQDLTCRTSRTVQTLQGVFTGSGSAVPPTVIFFSTAVAALQAGRMTVIGAGSSQQAIADLCQLRTEDFQRLGAAAQNANASFVAVELLESSASAPPAEASGGLENLAGSTGGDFLRMGGNVDAQMTRIGRAMSSYYIVTFSPEASDRSGSKRLELTVARAGITVRAPRELSLGKTGTGKSAAAPRDMIRAGTPFGELPLRATGFSSRNPGDAKVRVLALFEPSEPGVKLNAAMVGMFDQNGKLTAQWTAQAADLASPTTMAALVVPDGTYRMRVAATDGSDRSGAVDIHEFHATLIEAGPIKLGDLVLGRMGQNGPVPVMQFENEPEAVAIVELYGRPAGPLKMYVEIVPGTSADPIQVALTPSASSEPDKFLLVATLPIGDLKPGDYTVRAVVGVEGHPDAQVTSTLRKQSGS